MKKFKWIFWVAVTMLCGLTFTACDKEDNDDEPFSSQSHGGGSSSSDNGQNVRHEHDLDYWQTDYNVLISMIVAEFMSFEASIDYGDTWKARECQSNIIRLQQEAKEVRLAAADDGWTLEISPYETKSAYL